MQAYKDVYASRSPLIPKSEFYDMLGSGFSEACLATERDPKIAVQKRGLFLPALSKKALLGQEVIIQRCIDGFLEKLGKLGGGPHGLDMTKWYMMLSFDIAGEMAYGETFGCVESGKNLPNLPSSLSKAQPKPLLTPLHRDLKSVARYYLRASVLGHNFG